MRLAWTVFVTFVALEWFAFEMTATFCVVAQFLRRQKLSPAFRTCVTDIAFLKKTGDLKSEHLNNRNIRTANFYLLLSDAQYHGTGHQSSRPVFKWWSVNQMVTWIPNYHGTGHLNSKPFDERATPHDLTTELVCYSDPHWKVYILFTIQITIKIMDIEEKEKPQPNDGINKNQRTNFN